MKWNFSQTDPATVHELARAAAVPEFIAHLLLCRGIDTPSAAAAFFAPTLDHLHDPFLMRGMPEAVARLRYAIAHREPVLIYGDYDVDGTTATVLLKTTIQLLGGEARFHIPHRMREGYGMQAGVLEQAKADGARLVVSVDTGIRAIAAGETAALLGLDLIVTDHHLPDESLGIPQAIAVVNPNQVGCEYPCKLLCGAGVALKLCQALLEAHDAKRCREKLLPSFLKIVAIATIADAVPLLDENRVIVALGLKELRRLVNPGLRALFRKANLDIAKTAPTTTDIAFRIAPRINAAGRMDIATDVVELLTTQDPERAEVLAEKLHQLNDDRRKVEKEIVEEIDRRLEEDPTLGECLLLVLDGDGWHRGVLGIAASRILERTYRPVLVISHEDGEAHGSGRSISGFHLLDAITSCHDLLTRFGGHAHAVGFSLPSERVPELRRRLADYAASRLDADTLVPAVAGCLEISLDQLTPEAMDWLQKFAPLGMGNLEAVFVSRHLRVCAPLKLLKEKHVRLRLQTCQENGNATPSPAPLWNAIGWNMAQQIALLELQPESFVDIAYKMRHNDHPDFGGPELELIDVQLNADAQPNPA